MYRIKRDSEGAINAIQRIADAVYIPVDEGNADYQAYAAWVEEGNTPEADPSGDIEVLRSRKNDEINAWRLAANSSTFTHDGKTFACDALSRGDIDGTTSTLLLTGEFPQPWPGAWKAVDNTYYPIATIDEWKAFIGSMAAQGALNFARAQALKARLAVATTVDEIRAIQWNDDASGVL
ncbi:DUF4376 domain-containing protein [Cupriavidus sp. DB3]|uniref:DUF4376 domain-containing protein n=1 Tax=Cupriavidus sp. DB3 TaxID=2873259 RepID=UPI001CF2C181|nr:DUF4376 domain-containing protein [Cupriavidus sp. DB3]MCA7085861.1 DUF4376 domain-containing protein [Cupriavidus sp. DB3]